MTVRFWVVLAAAVAPLAASCSQPREMYQDAQVISEAGQLCFSVADTRQTRQAAPTIAAVTVSKQTSSGAIDVWKLRLGQAHPPVTLGPDDCIAYGHRVPTSQGADQRVYPLIPGERYSVDINSDVPDPAAVSEWLNRMYSRDFCLRAAADGTVQLVLVPWGRGEPQWQVCGPEGGSGPAAEGGP